MILLEVNKQIAEHIYGNDFRRSLASEHDSDWQAKHILANFVDRLVILLDKMCTLPRLVLCLQSAQTARKKRRREIKDAIIYYIKESAPRFNFHRKLVPGTALLYLFKWNVALRYKLVYRRTPDTEEN